MKTKSLYVSFFAALMLLFACKSQEKISIKFNPGINKKYAYTTVMDMKMDGSGMSATTTMEMGYEMKIKEKNEKGNNIISCVYTSIKMDVQSMGQKISYDSKNADKMDTSDMMGGIYKKIFSGFFGKEITMEVTPEGHVVSCKGFEAIFGDMMKSIGADTIPQMAAMAESFKQQYSDEQFGKQMEDAFGIMPGKEVKVGDTWEKDQEKAVMGMDVKSKAKYELKEIKDNKTAVVNVSSDIDMSGNKENANPMMGDMKTQGKQTGTIDVDLETGFPMSSNINMDMDMTMMGQSMKLIATVKTTATEIK